MPLKYSAKARSNLSKWASSLTSAAREDVEVVEAVADHALLQRLEQVRILRRDRQLAVLQVQEEVDEHGDCAEA